MKLDFANSIVKRLEVDDDEEADVVVALEYTSGSFSEEWAKFEFTYYGDRFDIWRYHGEQYGDVDERDLSPGTRYEIFTRIMEKTECQAVVGTNTDGVDVYCTQSGSTPVSEFESADEFVRYLILIDDFEDAEAAEDFFNSGGLDGFSLLDTEIQNMRAANYYQIRENYERHFAEMSGDDMRERIADKFAEKRRGHDELAEWAKAKRDEYGIRI